MSKRFSQIEAELRTLAADATTNLYRRLALADQLLTNPEWLAQHSASLDLGQQYIADKYFIEWRGVIDFAKLHAMFQKIEREVWERYKFDIAAIESLYDELHVSGADETVQRSRVSYKAEYEKARAEAGEAKARLATAERSVEILRHESDDLKIRLRQLENENAELRGRLSELEKAVNRFGVPALT